MKDLNLGKLLLHGSTRNGLNTFPSSITLIKTTFVGEWASFKTWHCKLGHPSIRLVKSILFFNKHPVSQNKNFPLCNSCQQAKSHNLPFYLSSSCSQSHLDLIFSDVWGPSHVPSVEGYRYYVTFLDNYRKFTWFYPLTRKSKAESTFLHFQSLFDCQFNSKIKSI